MMARSGLVSEIWPGRKDPFWVARGPGGLRLVMGGQKAHFRAEKWVWRPLEAIPSSGAAERKLWAVRADPMAKVSDRFERLGPPEDDCTGFPGDCTEDASQNGQKRAIFGYILGFSPPWGLKTGQKVGRL